MMECMFCGGALGKKRAREHVIAKSWMLELGVYSRVLSGKATAGTEVYSERSFPAHQFMAGDVCGPCNNGWMKDLDHEVKDHVLAMARQELQPADVPEANRPAIGRWALKTACAMEGTDGRHRRHIPIEVRRAVFENRPTPGSYALQACLFPVRAIGAATLDVWPDSPMCQDHVLPFPQSSRLKFGITVGHAVFAGVCLWDVEYAIYGTHANFHYPIFRQRAKNSDLNNDPMPFVQQLGWKVEETLPHAFSLLAIDLITVMPKERARPAA